MKTRFLFAAAILGCCAVSGCESGSSASSETEYTSARYTNCLYKGQAGTFADPYILKDGDTWYAYATEGEIATSKDMVHWTYAATVAKPTWYEGDQAGIWAPSVTKFGDTYNYYYSHSVWNDPNPGIGVMTSDSPLGPFVDRGKLFDSNDIGVTNSIDQDVFIDPVSNKVYLYWGSMYGNFAIELSSDGLSIKNPETMKEDKVWVAGNKDTTAWDVSSYEGSNMIYKDGQYYLFLSQGKCCEAENSTYHVKVGRSDSPLGPFIGSDGRDLKAGNRGDTVVKGDGWNTYGPGHVCVVQDDAGDWWMYYHSYIRDEYGVVNGRYMFLDKLSWAAGFPYVAPNFNPSLEETDGPRIRK